MIIKSTFISSYNAEFGFIGKLNECTIRYDILKKKKR